MKIYLTSVYVDDQDKALRFYTEVLGFIKKTDFPVGQFKWLTVASPEEPDGVQLLLEPNDNPAARQYQKEYERMKKLGIVFTMPPTQMGPATVAVFDDTCGNLINSPRKTNTEIGIPERIF